MVTINNNEYAYGDIAVTLWGQPVLGLTGINYKTAQDTAYVYGAGRSPRGIQLGNESHDGGLVILQSELEALNRTAISKGYRSIIGVPMDIIVTYADDGIITIDKICGAVISEFEKGMKQGDKNSEHTLPFKALGIKYNIAG